MTHRHRAAVSRLRQSQATERPDRRHPEPERSPRGRSSFADGADLCARRRVDHHDRRRQTRSPTASCQPLTSGAHTITHDDPPDRERARTAARQPRRLPHEGRPGPRALRGQGAEPPEPGAPVLAGEPFRDDPAAAHRVGHRPGPRPGVDDDRHRQRGAAAGGEPRQAPPAALQRPAQGRQELPVHQGHPGRRLPAHRADAQAARRRQPLLRALCVGEQRGRGHEPHPPPVPVPDLHHRHPGR